MHMQLEWITSNMFKSTWRPMIGNDYCLDDKNKSLISNTRILFDCGCYDLKVSNYYYGKFDTLIEAQIKAHEVLSDLFIHRDYRFPELCHMDSGYRTYPISHDIIGWKKAFCEDGRPVIVKLKIPKGTAANITAGKCRAEYATVLEAYYPFTDERVPTDSYIYSLWALNDIHENDRMSAKEKIDLNYELGMFRSGSRYKVGDTIAIPNFSRSCAVCAPGVHFFRSRYIAERFIFK